jgi:C1A family cysteine protease
MMTDVLVNHGPMTVCMPVDGKWQGYKTGIINSCQISSGGHCIFLVGGKSDGTNTLSTTTNFWKFRNSWGTGWG